jgi:deazaflavin-dependent oxidoreductase (nitroreductase family)
MPAPRWLARLNRRVTNHVMEPIARHAPGFGVVIHTGRTSGRTYRTPVNVFQRPGSFVFALTYGRDSQWVKNVLANGGCELETRGRTWRLTAPRLFHDPQHRAAPTPVGWILGLLKVDDFLEAKVEG